MSTSNFNFLCFFGFVEKLAQVVGREGVDRVAKLAADIDVLTLVYHAFKLTLANADTTTLRDVNLFLRCNDRFAEDSLTVHIRVRTPDSLQHEEPFVMVIPPAHTPAAISREADIPYRRRVRFDRTGDYHLTITPCRPVEGIEAVGIHIVKSQ